jgi:hypothetical protein
VKERSSEQNQLRADLESGRVMKQALHQAKLAYQFAPNTYTFEAMSAVHRLQQRLRNLRLTIGEDAGRSSPIASPRQETDDDKPNDQNAT